jgi:hypothetical protein
MKILTYILLLLIFIGLVYGFSLFQEFSYFSLTKDYVEVGTLLLRPIDYNDRKICTAGAYTSGKDISLLTDANNPMGTIWISAPVERSFLSTLLSKYSPKDKYQKARVRVCGTFQVSESKTRGFGPLRNYQYQITH